MGGFGRISSRLILFVEVFFQACFAASPIRSAVDFLPGATIASPFAFVAGAMVTTSKKYRPANWIR